MLAATNFFDVLLLTERNTRDVVLGATPRGVVGIGGVYRFAQQGLGIGRHGRARRREGVIGDRRAVARARLDGDLKAQRNEFFNRVRGCRDPLFTRAAFLRYGDLYHVSYALPGMVRDRARTMPCRRSFAKWDRIANPSHFRKRHVITL